MENILILLSELKRMIPTVKCNHSILLNSTDDKLMICVQDEELGKWATFLLDESDLQRSGKELAMDIYKMWFSSKDKM